MLQTPANATNQETMSTDCHETTFGNFSLVGDQFSMCDVSTQSSNRNVGLLRSGMPSSTAKSVAIHRAVHQLTEGGRVFRDALAVRILSMDEESILEDSQYPMKKKMRFFVCVRSRFAEDSLEGAVRSKGVKQTIVLGAGLDTFAYRCPHKDLRVFEVDHPASQAWKKDRVAAAGIDAPANLTYAPVDFESGDDLGERLRAAGFDAELPTFVAWLGVVPYLTEAAVLTTLRFVGSLRASEIVFDYGNPPAQLSAEGRVDFEKRARKVAEKGEPWLTTFDTERLKTLLRECGFTELEDLGRQEFIPRYAPTAPASGDDNFGPHLMRASKLKPLAQLS
jgi:methyltransferase (TIGR00027 family)